MKQKPYLIPKVKFRHTLSGQLAIFAVQIMITFLLAVAIGWTVAHAQTPPIATPIKLNPEASKEFTAIEARQNEIVRQANAALQQLDAQKQSLLLGSGVPRADLTKVECAADVSGIVACAPKKQEAAFGNQQAAEPKAANEKTKAKSP